jgi:hypothetical protein
VPVGKQDFTVVRHLHVAVGAVEVGAPLADISPASAEP